jgi:hypothetical protein
VAATAPVGGGGPSEALTANPNVATLGQLTAL